MIWQVWLFQPSDGIPDVPVPLAPEDPELLPLNRILHEVYDRAGYDLIIDYAQPPVPPVR